MDVGNQLHLVSALFVFAAAIVPIYLSFRLTNAKYKSLLIALAVFIIFHGIYHVFGSVGNEFLASSVFEPLSAAALVVFGAMYLLAVRNVGNEKRKQANPRV